VKGGAHALHFGGVVGVLGVLQPPADDGDELRFVRDLEGLHSGFDALGLPRVQQSAQGKVGVCILNGCMHDAKQNIHAFNIPYIWV